MFIVCVCVFRKMTNATGSESSPHGKAVGFRNTRVFSGRGPSVSCASAVACDSYPMPIAVAVKTAVAAAAAAQVMSSSLSPRQKSPKPRVNRGSPTIVGHYAGAKFSDPPAPAALPPPPPHWTIAGPEQLDIQSHQLKLLLNVQA